MAHILGVYIPEEKRLVIGLTNLYGIGRSKALAICKRLNIDESARVYDLPNTKLAEVFKLLASEYLVETNLKRSKSYLVKQLMEISSHRGFRHRVGLPLRGQRTHTNGKTQKKLANKHRKES